MGKCDRQTFTGLTSAGFAELARQARSLGLPLEGESGQATRDGITVAWSYDAANSSLAIECTDAPRFMPCSMINGRIESVVSGILAKSQPVAD